MEEEEKYEVDVKKIEANQEAAIFLIKQVKSQKLARENLLKERRVLLSQVNQKFDSRISKITKNISKIEQAAITLVSKRMFYKLRSEYARALNAQKKKPKTLNS
jgi:carboxylesterase type B